MNIRRVFIVSLLGLCGLNPAWSQEPEAPAAAPEVPVVDSPAALPAAEPDAPTTRPQGNRVVSLQTTITGNQEQPQVLYIIPWQSPRASDTDFEQLDSQRVPVFGHLERDEFQRELEARGEFD